MMYSGMFGFGLHGLLFLVFIFAVVGALMWMYKYADKKTFLNVIIIALIVAGLAAILAVNLSWRGRNRMLDYMQQQFQQNNVPFNREEVGRGMYQMMFR